MANKAIKSTWAKDKAELQTKRVAYWDYISKLIEVVDSGSYLEEYTNQDDFLRNEADIGDRQFRYLRSACETRQRIGTIVPPKTGENVKESAYREISKAPEKDQAQIFAEVSEKAESEGRQPTAKDFAKAVKAASVPTSDDSPPAATQSGHDEAAESSVDPFEDEGEYEDVEDEPEPPKPDAWKVERSKAKKTAEALQRAVDDLNDLKRRKSDHARLIEIAQEAVRILEGWK